LTLAVLACATQAFAAVPDSLRAKPGPWTYGGTAALNLSQSAYSSNWSGGDKGSINWVLQGDVKAQRQTTRWFNLTNGLQLSYGQTAKQVRDPENPNRIVFDRPEKTTDLIRLESTGRFTLDSWVDPFLGLRFESQFSDQSDPRGDLSLNPVRLSQTAGLARVLIKDERREWITRVGMSFREVFARAFADTAGDATRSFTSVDGGIEWLTTVSQPLVEKKILYQGRLLVFAPLFFDKSGDLETFDRLAIAASPGREAVKDFWQTPSVNFQNTFTAPITKNLNVNLFVQWIYEKYDESTNLDLTKPVAALIPIVDGGIRKAGQFKQTLSIGVTYTLF
jgi:hypothetical protein